LLLNESGQEELAAWIKSYLQKMNAFGSNLHSQSNDNVYSVNQVQPTYAENAVEDTDGRMILRDNFDAIFTKYPEALIFGEDAGAIGDVNQGLEGMQENMENFAADVGIREDYHRSGIGMVLRGLQLLKFSI
jgi:hypothetical protein